MVYSIYFEISNLNGTVVLEDIEISCIFASRNTEIDVIVKYPSLNHKTNGGTKNEML